MNKKFVQAVVLFLKIIICYGQKIAYNETCNSTEECSDHRYKCQPDLENVLRCLCDRFHFWDEHVGCVQMYNATEIIHMTVNVTDNIKFLKERVDFIIKAQIAAGLFVFGMVIFAALTVTIFCVYVHIKDRQQKRQISRNKKKADSQRYFQGYEEPKASTSLSTV